jgi:hypothetical protein
MRFYPLTAQIDLSLAFCLIQVVFSFM